MRRRNVAPPRRARAKTYYHGIHPDLVEQVLASGEIRPRADTGVRESGTRQWLEPRPGKVYLTPSARMAWKYTDMDPGVEVVVAVDGDDLVDIEPDEDNVGALVYTAGWGKVPGSSTSPEGFEEDVEAALWKKRSDGPGFRQTPLAQEVLSIAQSVLTKAQWEAMTGERRGDQLAMLAKVGKKVLPHLPDRLAARIIQMGSNIAHDGPVRIIGAVACPPGAHHEYAMARYEPGRKVPQCAELYSLEDYRALKRKLMR